MKGIFILKYLFGEALRAFPSDCCRQQDGLPPPLFDRLLPLNMAFGDGIKPNPFLRIDTKTVTRERLIW
jgi:hypothetical protein